MFPAISTGIPLVDHPILPSCLHLTKSYYRLKLLLLLSFQFTPMSARPLIHLWAYVSSTSNSLVGSARLELG